MHVALVAALALALAAATPGGEAPSAVAEAPGGEDPSRGAAVPGLEDVALDPPEPGRVGVAVVAGGKLFVGRVVSLEAGGRVRVEVDADTQVIVPGERFRGVLPGGALPYGSAGPDGTRPVRLVLGDGAVVVGRFRVLPSRRGEPALEAVEGGPPLPPDVVAFFPVPVEGRRIAPRARYLEAPSALPLAPGEAHASSTQLVHLAVAAGLPAGFELSVGTALPALQADVYGANVQGALRGGVGVGRFRLAAGLHGSSTAAGARKVHLSATGSATFARGHVSVHAGPVFPGANEWAALGDVGAALAAAFAVGGRTDVIAELWASREGLDRSQALLLAAARIRRGRAALDLGGRASLGAGSVGPWLGVTVDLTP